MCGITGIIAFNETGRLAIPLIENALETLNQRGPDSKGIYQNTNIALAHSRLAIIDTSNAASQPFTDASGRYTIIFNGEFFNFKEHQQYLINKGIQLISESDTEVLLYLYILEKEKCLDKINGFFAFAIYDAIEQSLFIARDRYGVKPLLLYNDEHKFIFASEMKALLAFNIPKIIDEVSLYTYLQLNYIPAPYSIFKNVSKLLPGTYLKLQNGKTEIIKYYEIPLTNPLLTTKQPEEHKKTLINLLDESVQKRLVADVPLGAFLSGGLDSSIITALAAQHTQQLNTFSIGYKNEPHFDETYYAQLVAKKYNTNHTVFSLSNDDLFANLHQTLNYIDEPFADSSALAVNILSMHTRKYVTVALSGDGADELFAGYNKHRAEYQARAKGAFVQLAKLGAPLWKALPKSRNSKFGNTIRQLQKFSDGTSLTAKERYWRWAGYSTEQETANLLKSFSGLDKQQHVDFKIRQTEILKYISEAGDINDVLYTDMLLVLQNDMLTKVDMMSMANSLEVRTPFLDVNVVNFVASLPSAYKIDQQHQKKLLREAFRTYLPEELFYRKKQGFELPLLKWFRTELKTLIVNDLLADDFIIAQGIFNIDAVRKLKLKLFSNNPNDVVAQIWGLIVFQYWWKQTMSES